MTDNNATSQNTSQQPSSSVNQSPSSDGQQMGGISHLQQLVLEQGQDIASFKFALIQIARQCNDLASAMDTDSYQALDGEYGQNLEENWSEASNQLSRIYFRQGVLTTFGITPDAVSSSVSSASSEQTPVVSGS